MLAVPCVEKTAKPMLAVPCVEKTVGYHVLPQPVADRALHWEVALPLKASTKLDPGGRSCSALRNDIAAQSLLRD